MAVTSVKRIGDNRQGDHNNNLDGAVNLAFRVRTSDPLDGKMVVLAGVDPQTGLTVPPPWADYGPPWVSAAEAAAMAASLGGIAAVPKTSACLCIRRDARQPSPANANVWEVACTFQASNPLTMPMEVFWDGERVKIGLDSDLDGNPILNSAGVPFSPPCEVDSSLHTLEVTKNYSDYDPLFFAWFMGQQPPGAGIDPQGFNVEVTAGCQTGGCVNEDDWWDYAAGTVRLVNVKNDFIDTIETPVPYHRRKFSFLVNLAGWSWDPLDRGFSGFNLQGIHQDPFRGPGNMVRAKPTLLDGFGFENPPGAKPVYLTFEVYPPGNFDLLDIPHW